MNPKFSVGEVVILQSADNPKCNGETTVLQVLNDGDRYICHVTGRRVRNEAGLAYVLDVDILDATETCMQWDECAIRKKHQPGEHSFNDLMASLNSKSIVKAQL